MEEKSNSSALVTRESALSKLSDSRKSRVIKKFMLAALGSIPWVGGFISAAASIPDDEKSVNENILQTEWLKEHEAKLERLAVTISDIAERFQGFGGQIEERINSEEYLELVRKAFRAWDRADTDDKRRYVANLITNSAGTKLCSDDVIRLFIDWLNTYHEAHFAVIREIYTHSGTTRYDMWHNLRGELPREDSAEADLFKLLIRDLSTGGVIRQSRDTDSRGNFLRQQHKSKATGPYVESAFERSKTYELTELGKQFVHYTMNEVVERISSEEQGGNRG